MALSSTSGAESDQARFYWRKSIRIYVSSFRIPKALSRTATRYVMQCTRFYASLANIFLQFWEREYPESLADGRVQLQTHDFFKPQPVKNAAAFFLRFVLHDWPAEKAQSILKALRPSATPNTKLIVLDQILPHAVPGLEENNPGDKISIPPVPLLPNWGAVNVSCYMTDIHVRANSLLCFQPSLMDLTADDALFEWPGAYTRRVDCCYRGDRMAAGGHQACQGCYSIQLGFLYCLGLNEVDLTLEIRNDPSSNHFIISGNRADDISEDCWLAVLDPQ